MSEPTKTQGILIWGERHNNGKLAPVVFELVTKARELSAALDNCKITVLLVGNFENTEAYKAELEDYGVNELAVISLPELEEYNTKNYATVTLDYLKNNPQQIFLIGATRQGRDLAPQISSALETGLTADCTGLEINENKRLAATRPTFGGELMATILCKTEPQMATVRPGVFEAQKTEIPQKITITNVPPCQFTPSKKRVLERFELPIETDSIENAQIILAGGKGLKDKETFEKLHKLAERIGAKVGATRKAVEAGLAPQSIQIGQTGKNVSPAIYVAFGISGAIQHCVGINGAKTIIAINTDKNAPIINSADKTIIADASEVIDEWLQQTESNDN